MINAFENPDGTVVAVITSFSTRIANCNLRFENHSANIQIKPKSITTVVIEK